MALTIDSRPERPFNCTLVCWEISPFAVGRNSLTFGGKRLKFTICSCVCLFFTSIVPCVFDLFVQLLHILVCPAMVLIKMT